MSGSSRSGGGRGLPERSVRVPVFVLPARCWRCGGSMRVLFPTGEEVARALPGTLRLVGGEWVNVCPHCGAVYGNLYLADHFLNFIYSGLRKYCIGFVRWEPRCAVCGKPLYLEEKPLVTDDDYANAATDYISRDHFLCEECARRELERTRRELP